MLCNEVVHESVKRCVLIFGKNLTTLYTITAVFPDQNCCVPRLGGGGLTFMHIKGDAEIAENSRQ